MLLAVLFIVHDNIVIFVVVIVAPKVRRVTIVCAARVLGFVGTEQGQKACKEQKGTENYYASRRERIGDVSRVNVCEGTEC